MQVDDFSIEAQKIACLKNAKEQGYEVTEDHQYIDEAYSAKNEERSAFRRMIMAAHSAEFSMIIIHKMDRFEQINKIKNRMERRCEAYSVTGILPCFLPPMPLLTLVCSSLRLAVITRDRTFTC